MSGIDEAVEVLNAFERGLSIGAAFNGGFPEVRAAIRAVLANREEVGSRLKLAMTEWADSNERLLARAEASERIQAELRETIAELREVAWRCRDYADGWLFFTSEADAKRYAAETGSRIEALLSRHTPAPEKA